MLGVTTGAAAAGLADITRRVKGCHLTVQTRVQRVLDDVAGTGQYLAGPTAGAGEGERERIAPEPGPPRGEAAREPRGEAAREHTGDGDRDRDALNRASASTCRSDGAPGLWALGAPGLWALVGAPGLWALRGAMSMSGNGTTAAGLWALAVESQDEIESKT